MTNIAKFYFILFGVLTIAGGIMGYVKASSTPSLIAGSIAGIILLVAAFLIPRYVTPGLVTGLVISIALAGQFVPKFINTKAMMPAGMMSVLSVVGIVLAILAFVKK